MPKIKPAKAAHIDRAGRMVRDMAATLEYVGQLEEQLSKANQQVNQLLHDRATAQQELGQVDDSRGAPMGRSATSDVPSNSHVYVYLAEVELDEGGYDNGGAYWGIGSKLWAIQILELSATIGYVRGATLDDATASVLKRYPNAKILNNEQA